jgi:hypothetical protein
MILYLKAAEIRFQIYLPLPVQPELLKSTTASRLCIGEKINVLLYMSSHHEKREKRPVFGALFSIFFV